jgi:hypothetical protein
MSRLEVSRFANLSRFAKATSAAVLAALLAASDASAAGVFADFDGSYKGAGKITDVNGKSESLSCRSTNTPAQDGIAMNLALVCASDSYRLDFHSDLYTDGHTLRGTWSETSRNASGDVSGTIVPDLISATTSAPGFSANIVIQIQKNGRLDVALSAQGTRINKVQVSMKR